MTTLPLRISKPSYLWRKVKNEDNKNKTRFFQITAVSATVSVQIRRQTNSRNCSKSSICLYCFKRFRADASENQVCCMLGHLSRAYLLTPYVRHNVRRNRLECAVQQMCSYKFRCLAFELISMAGNLDHLKS
jgi:hypothetical protein